jgi:hypothetical protein
MTPQPVPLTRRLATQPQPKEPVNGLPRLWTELEPQRQQQLAQHLAELIRRIRLQANQMESKSHEPF